MKAMVIAVGIGCPGQSKNGVLVAASNFPGWKNVPFSSLISERLGGIPVTLLNDADAAIAAEVWGGSHPRVQHAAMISE